MRYVLATDGSEASLKAASWLAQHLPGNGGGELFMLYVFPLPSDLETYSQLLFLPEDASDERVARLARPVHERTRRALGEVGMAVHSVALVGNPAEVIVEFACAQRADLLVLGHHGHSPRRELALGSVANAVAHRALCPVLVVR